MSVRPPRLSTRRPGRVSGQLRDLDFDCLGHGRRRFRQRDLQHAVLEERLHVRRVDLAWHREPPEELAILPLDAVILLALFLFFELPLSLDGERAILQPNLDVFFLHIGQIDGDRVLFLGLVDGGAHSGNTKGSSRAGMSVNSLFRRPCISSSSRSGLNLTMFMMPLLSGGG